MNSTKLFRKGKDRFFKAGQASFFLSQKVLATLWQITFIYKLLIQFHVSFKVLDIPWDNCSSLCNTNFSYRLYLNLSKCLHKLDRSYLWTRQEILSKNPSPKEISNILIHLTQEYKDCWLRNSYKYKFTTITH